jgi:hypothetical protein
VFILFKNFLFKSRDNLSNKNITCDELYSQLNETLKDNFEPKWSKFIEIANQTDPSQNGCDVKLVVENNSSKFCLNGQDADVKKMNETLNHLTHHIVSTVIRSADTNDLKQSIDQDCLDLARLVKFNNLTFDSEHDFLNNCDISKLKSFIHSLNRQRGENSIINDKASSIVNKLDILIPKILNKCNLLQKKYFDNEKNNLQITTDHLEAYFKITKQNTMLNEAKLSELRSSLKVTENSLKNDLFSSPSDEKKATVCPTNLIDSPKNDSFSSPSDEKKTTVCPTSLIDSSKNDLFSSPSDEKRTTVCPTNQSNLSVSSISDDLTTSSISGK